jgi:hypothetical protein
MTAVCKESLQALPSTPPDYAAQSAEVLSDTEALAWFDRCGLEAKAQGCQLVRYAVHQTIPHLRLVEGWTGGEVNQGEPGWFLAAAMEETP